MEAIELVGVTKTFGSVESVSDLDLTVEQSEVFALLGPNGSGKTTLLNILLGLIRPTAGQSKILGHDTTREPRTARQQLGVVPEGCAVYERLTARRHVQFAAASRNVSVAPEAILDRVGLAAVADRTAGTFSGGMAKRLVLALALVGQPAVLLLDEPFYGLDPQASETLRRVIRTEQNRGATVLFTTHLFREVQTLADRYGMLSGGELVNEGTISELDGSDESGDVIETEFRDCVEPTVRQ